MKFYLGLHQPSDAKRFAGKRPVMISVNRLRDRVADLEVGEWMLDSGAFSELHDHGRFRESPEQYADRIVRWWRCGYLAAAVSQDYMCEPPILAKTGLTVADHQRLTIERYDAIRALIWPLVYVMPVMQGFTPAEYGDHLRQYGDRLRGGQWVGVGSVCKRQGDPAKIAAVLSVIHLARPDLRLHGFGLKTTALRDASVRALLHSADSMAWSYAARRQKRNQNDWREAEAFAQKVAG